MSPGSDAHTTKGAALDLGEREPLTSPIAILISVARIRRTLTRRLSGLPLLLLPRLRARGTARFHGFELPWGTGRLLGTMGRGDPGSAPQVAPRAVAASGVSQSLQQSAQAARSTTTESAGRGVAPLPGTGPDHRAPAASNSSSRDESAAPSPSSAAAEHHGLPDLPLTSLARIAPGLIFVQGPHRMRSERDGPYGAEPPGRGRQTFRPAPPTPIPGFSWRVRAAAPAGGALALPSARTAPPDGPPGPGSRPAAPIGLDAREPVPPRFADGGTPRHETPGDPPGPLARPSLLPPMIGIVPARPVAGAGWESHLPVPSSAAAALAGARAEPEALPQAVMRSEPPMQSPTMSHLIAVADGLRSFVIGELDDVKQTVADLASRPAPKPPRPERAQSQETARHMLGRMRIMMQEERFRSGKLR